MQQASISGNNNLQDIELAAHFKDAIVLMSGNEVSLQASNRDVGVLAYTAAFDIAHHSTRNCFEICF